MEINNIRISIFYNKLNDYIWNNGLYASEGYIIASKVFDKQNIAEQDKFVDRFIHLNTDNKEYDYYWEETSEPVTGKISRFLFL